MLLKSRIAASIKQEKNQIHQPDKFMSKIHLYLERDDLGTLKLADDRSCFKRDVHLMCKIILFQLRYLT